MTSWSSSRWTRTRRRAAGRPRYRGPRRWTRVAPSPPWIDPDTLLPTQVSSDFTVLIIFYSLFYFILKVWCAVHDIIHVKVKVFIIPVKIRDKLLRIFKLHSYLTRISLNFSFILLSVECFLEMWSLVLYCLWSLCINLLDKLLGFFLIIYLFI